MLHLLDPLRTLGVGSTVFRLLLVLLCGGSIGYERGHRGRAAGLRTHVLVALGACLVMMTDQYIVTFISHTADPARLGAQVISGIGFLGAGTIMITGRQVTGLTTAAGLWAAACIGLAIGIGFYEGAVLATACILFTMTVLHSWENRISYISTQCDLLVELSSSEDISPLLDTLKELNAHISDMEISDSLKRVSKPGNVLVTLTLQVPKKFRVENVAASLSRKVEIVMMKEI